MYYMYIVIGNFNALWLLIILIITLKLNFLLISFLMGDNHTSTGIWISCWNSEYLSNSKIRRLLLFDIPYSTPERIPTACEQKQIDWQVTWKVTPCKKWLRWMERLSQWTRIAYIESKFIFWIWFLCQNCQKLRKIKMHFNLQNIPGH